LSHEETDYGRWEDKLAKNLFVCSEVPKHLRGMRCVGVIGEEPESGLMEIGVPLGVIVALCPVTSPVSTTIYKALLAVKSGNAIIFSPHPGALKSISTALDIMIAAAEAQGLPQGCLSYLSTVSKSGTAELMRHPATTLIMISGVPGMFQAARSTGKPIIYGGAGHGPAFIERTADLRQAVQDIILSTTFDNGIAPSAEQSVVVETCITQDVKRIFQEHGAYFMSEGESLRLTDRFFHTDGRCKRSMVGLSADVLAKRADIPAPAGVKLLLAERKYVSEADPYSRGFFAPVLAYYVEDDWEHACEKCIELLLHERNAHTLVIHSNNKDVIRQFALKKPVGRMLVNTPAAYGGVGMSTNLFPAMTLGSGSAGYGITSDNVSPLNLIYRRKVGYGVRKAPAQTGAELPVTPDRIDNTLAEADGARRLEALQRILTEAIEAMNRPSDR
jgi:acyl-CoA reductase-like NAD-dependent aldehyde dehydrogenase